MKLLKLLFLVIGLFLTGSTFAQDKGLGIGVILGQPTGFSLKSWTGQKTAIDASVGWDLNRGSFNATADMVIHNFDVIELVDGRLPFYFGIGGALNVTDNVDVGIRVPLGVDYMLDDFPIDLFAEVVPVMDFIPSTKFHFNGGIGVRYFFSK